MKKLILLALVTVFLTGTAYAGELTLTGQTGGMQLYGTVAAAGTGQQTPIARMSNNVYMTGQYSDTGYAISTYHKSGTKAYGTGYDSTSIFWAGIGENCITDGCFAVPSSSLSDEAFAGWTPM